MLTCDRCNTVAAYLHRVEYPKAVLLLCSACRDTVEKRPWYRRSAWPTVAGLVVAALVGVPWWAGVLWIFGAL